MAQTEYLMSMDGTKYFNSPSREFLLDRYNLATMSHEDFLLTQAIRQADRERFRLYTTAQVVSRKQMRQKERRQKQRAEQKQRRQHQEEEVEDEQKKQMEAQQQANIDEMKHLLHSFHLGVLLAEVTASAAAAQTQKKEGPSLASSTLHSQLSDLLMLSPSELLHDLFE
jgi:hypothetical protein